MITNSTAAKFIRHKLGREPREVYVVPHVYNLTADHGRGAVLVGLYTQTIRAQDLAMDANWAAHHEVAE